MNRKILLVLVLVAVLVIGVLLFLKLQPAQPYTNEMTAGIIKNINGNLITVEGIISDSKTNHREDKTVEFQIEPSIQLTKLILTAPATTKPGDTFTPQIKGETGLIADLRAGIQIPLIKSSDNLFTTNEITVSEITYEILSEQ